MQAIINNETKKLSRKRKKRIERKQNFSDVMKLILNKIKKEKKKKYKIFHKFKQLEILLVRIKCADKANKLESALRELNKIEVIDKNLHEIKIEMFLDYVGAFEMVGNLKLVIKLEKQILDLEILAIMKLMLKLLMKDMMRRMLFSMVIFKKLILLNLKK